MTAIPNRFDTDLLTGWLECKPYKTATRRRATAATPAGLRFAFYGRVSTKEFQDRTSSHAWQLESARELVAGHGSVVAEFFDIGHSRRRPWLDRPQAAALLAALAAPDRRFDAIVVGEYERAFHGDQLIQLLPLLDRHGIQIWLPEAHGPVNIHDPSHHALVMLLGAQSKREVQRSRFRVLAAMRAQAREQGRYLGGRPAYGYRLTDAGPHPNTAHAQWGRRLQRLEPDPATADHVRWIFAQRLVGESIAGIARALNENGVSCPSGADPDRNRHRTGAGWTVQTVAAILTNPRYTGRQVWNRQRTDREPAGPGTGREREVLRSNPACEWVISKTIAHPGLVSEDDYIAAQTISAVPAPEDGSTRVYALVGLLICRICGRRLESHWVYHRPGYRCRHGHTSAKPAVADRPKNLYLREDHILALVANQLDRQSEVSPRDAMIDSDPGSVAEFLRSNNISIVCDADGCVVAYERTDQPELIN